MFKRKTLTQAEWYSIGVVSGYCSEMVCDTHEGIGGFMSDDEMASWEEGNNDCYWVVRLIEQDHE